MLGRIFSALPQRSQTVAQAYPNDTVVIPRSEYTRLQDAAREYQVLMNALVAAGTPIESIRILIQSSESQDTKEDDASHTTTGNAAEPYGSIPIMPTWSKRDDISPVSTLTDPKPLSAAFTSDDESVKSEYTMEEEGCPGVAYSTESHQCRSIVLKGLPDLTTLEEVANIVKGGAILNFFIRHRQAMAHIAFLDPQAAEVYLVYAKEQGLSINGKRLTAHWDKKQYYMTDGIAKHVQYGASRNLVVRFPRPEITDEVIREDLEHIDRLAVVDLHFRDGHAWISLNSIKHAITARSCMASRRRYHGCRIEFWPDECAEPLPSGSKVRQAPGPNNPPTAFSNRFLALRNSNMSTSESD